MARPLTTTPKPRGRRILGMDEQARQDERRRLLLDAALEMFGTKGFARTSIEALCQTAGVGTNSFYEVFPNKEAVLIALYDQIIDRLENVIATAYAENMGEPRIVRAIVAAFVHEVTDDPRVTRVAFIEVMSVSPQIAAHRRITRDRFYDGIETLGTQLRVALFGPEPQPRLGPSSRRNAIAVVGAIVEMTMEWFYSPDPDPIDQLIDDAAFHCERVLKMVSTEQR